MNVHDLLRSKGSRVVTAPTGSTVADVLQLMAEHRIGAVPLVDDAGGVAGLVDEGGLVRALAERGAAALAGTVAPLMQQPAPTCAPSASLKDVMHLMTHGRYRHVVVVEEGAIRGIVSLGDLVHLRLAELEMESNVLRDYIVRTRTVTA